MASSSVTVASPSSNSDRSGDERATATSAAAPPDPGGAATEPVVARDDVGTVLAATLAPGQPLPARTIPVTTTLIVAGALMTSDYFDAHHDRDAAVRRGSKDVFMNVHTTFGLIEAWAGSWLGPNARWRSISARLGVTNYPGDVMTLAGGIDEVDPATGEWRSGSARSTRSASMPAARSRSSYRADPSSSSAKGTPSPASRRWRMTFPAALRGSRSRNSTWAGTLYGASAAAAHDRTASLSRSLC